VSSALANSFSLITDPLAFTYARGFMTSAQTSHAQQHWLRQSVHPSRLLPLLI
jgi:hypothetical protein